MIKWHEVNKLFPKKNDKENNNKNTLEMKMEKSILFITSLKQ